MTNNIKNKKSSLWVGAKIIRVITVPPLMALFVFTAFLFTENFYESISEYFIAVGFIGLLPFTAYPLQLIIPPFKHQGRDGQRNLAFIMCNLGYVFAVAAALIFDSGAKISAMLITYLLSGMTLLLINKLFKFKASGHSCGLLGPLGIVLGWIDPTNGYPESVTVLNWVGLVLVCFVLPALLSFAFNEILRKTGLVKDGYMKLD